MKTLHDAYEAKRVLKQGETRVEFEGLDTKNKKGKVVGEASIGGPRGARGEVEGRGREDGGSPRISFREINDASGFSSDISTLARIRRAVHRGGRDRLRA
jgi:hypothetical protein